ncbi:serine/threonine-protein phosphatase 1 regulatory subunit 10 [Nematostella vectensis]|nr:serine/threonine-protein phosphatase 1 regulatory subunit 10 [Nematostella vectensis]XP_032241918.1 serine/threonine-protein phosphatase 1 regulatory subunit 10 [Nematostella vectensis]
MGTSGGEPKTLLNALKPLLGFAGDIKSQDVMRIISLMRDAEKLMSRCVYINILKATIVEASENKDAAGAVDKFITVGGWAVLNRWLSDAKKTDNLPLVIELLQLLKDLPVSVDTLKQGNTGKLVRSLTKVDNKEVKDLSTSVLKQWMDMVRTQSDKADKPQKNGDSPESDISDVSGKDLKNSDVKLGKRPRDDDPKKSPSEKKLKRSNSQEENGKPVKVKKEVNKALAMESAGFMNALATAAVAAPRKRKRPATTAQKTPTATTPTTPTASTAVKPSYTGILDEIMSNQSQTHGIEGAKEKAKSKEKDGGSNGSDKPPTDGSSDATTGDAGDFASKETNGLDKDTSQESSTTASTPSTAEDVTESSDPPVRKPNKKGQMVTWAEDNKIATFHFFEMDEDERALVRHPVNFTNAIHLEMMKERELLEKAKHLKEDKMLEKVKWYKPKGIEGISAAVLTGSKSQQRAIQKERESSVLADIFFSKSSVPDSPAEPDNEHEKVAAGEPKVIPHDEKGTTHIPPKEMAPPTTTESSQSGVQLPGALASLFSSSGSTQSTQPADKVSVQSLLDKIMSGGSSGQPNPLMQLLSSTKQQQSPSQDQGSNLPPALKNILEPLNRGAAPGPRPPGGLLGSGPGDSQRMPHPMGPPGPFGPRGPVPDNFRFQGPGGPRQGPPMGPAFPGHDGMRMRGPMPPRMPQPRPLLPELAKRDDFHDDNFDQFEGDDDEGPNNGPNMRGRVRGGPRGRGRGRGRRNPPPVCRHFVSNRGCLRGEQCHFLHPGINGPPI